MNTRARTPSRRSWALAAGGLVAVVLLAVVGIWRSSIGPADPIPQAGAAVVARAPLTVPVGATVLVFGDSWTYGSAASAPTLGYAYVLGETQGWNTIVDGVRGSGYLKPGLDGGTFGERIADLDPDLDPDLVIVEGSINDRRLPATGYRDAVAAAWDALAARYPAASVVILGPAPQVLPVEKATARIDADLADLADARGWWYVSPIAEDWITPENYASVIDSSEIGRDHPSTAGHAYLAERVTEALEAMATGTEITADDR